MDVALSCRARMRAIPLLYRYDNALRSALPSKRDNECKSVKVSSEEMHIFVFVPPETWKIPMHTSVCQWNTSL